MVAQQNTARNLPRSPTLGKSEMPSGAGRSEVCASQTEVLAISLRGFLGFFSQVTGLALRCVCVRL